MKKSIFKKAWEIFSQKGVGEFFKKLLVFIHRPLKPTLTRLAPILAPYAKWRISRELKKKPTTSSLINFLFNNFGHLIRPKQVRWEIAELAKIVEKLKPQTVLEIGTAKGGTLFIYTRLATEKAKIISIDLPWENKGGYPAWRTRIYEKFASPNQNLILLRADSHRQETVDRLSQSLAGEKIDFLFIDGDHTYNGVKRDYELYSPFVRENGGVIAFHDVAKHNSDPECQVDRFWDEIKIGKNFKEFIANPDQDWGGIGVIFTNGN